LSRPAEEPLGGRRSPRRAARGDDRVEGRIQRREPRSLDEDQRDGPARARHDRVQKPGDRRREPADHDEPESAPAIGPPAEIRREQEDRRPNIANVSPISSMPAPSDSRYRLR
jgi:hypothetical protein